MRMLAVAMVLLLAGCECFPAASVQGVAPVRFGVGLCRETEIHRIEFRSADNEVLWRIDAEPPVHAGSIGGEYGVVPTGFVQTFPRTGRVPPLTVDRLSLVVYDDYCVFAEPFCRGTKGYGYDFDRTHWEQPYMKP